MEPNIADFDRDLADLTTNSSDSSPYSLLFMDLDKFKSINDGPGGHEAGDRALIALGKAVLAVAKGKGSAYRYGGDEVCVILPNHTVDEAVAVAERIRREVHSIKTTERPDGLSSSLGVACFPETTTDPAGLFKAADRAMYIAKEAGGNRVSSADMIEVSRVSEKPVSHTAELNRNSLAQDLERTVRQTLDHMTHTGHLLLRHLLMREPLEVGRPFMREILIERQNEQMAIALESGIVRHDEKRQGADGLDVLRREPSTQGFFREGLIRSLAVSAQRVASGAPSTRGQDEGGKTDPADKKRIER